MTGSEWWIRAGCTLLVREFAHEIVEEWKGWLTGSLPMAALAIVSLANPEWTRLPVWVWAILIFVAGLLHAMFRVYRELRRQRDALQEKLVGIGIAGPFFLVPFDGRFGPSDSADFRPESIRQ